MSSIRATVKLSLALIFLFFAIFTFNYFSSLSKSQSPDWLEGWQYRREITITNPGGYLDHYQIMITLDTASLISQGKMREDCGDIRFADSNGVTFLSYWVNPSTCNSPNTEIWVRVVDIPASSEKKIYLYYGSPNTEKNLGKLWNIPHLGISGGVFDYDAFKMMYRLGVDAGDSHTCILKSDGTVDCYGTLAEDYLSGDAIAVSAGWGHTCILKSDGTVDCYGNNDYGQAEDYLGGDAIAVSAGGYHTCVLKSNGNVDCYGNNYYGQDEDYTLGDAIAVSAGGYHTCVLKSNGNVDCYGYNLDGSAEDYLGGDAIAVSAGGWHTCVLKSNGIVDCYGYNLDGSAEDYLGGDAIAVSAGRYHTCILKSDGTVDCYGTLAEDYLGGDAIAVSAGGAHTCILKSNGNVDCYGDNWAGQAEDYLAGDAYNPFRVYAVPEPTINIGSEESSGVPPTPVCGNNICEEAEGENVYNCPEDCPGYCGDGYCNPYYENIETCLQDCEFAYSVPIFIQNPYGSQLTDYQIRLVIDTRGLISQGKMREDCGDIRFVDSENNLLSYWVENCNSTRTFVWVKVPVIPAEGTTIYYLFGNPNAMSMSSIQNTFIANSIYAVQGDYYGYFWGHYDTIYARQISPYWRGYVDKIYWGSVADGTEPGSDYRDYFYSRFRFLFAPDVSGYWTFAIDSDEASELIFNPGDEEYPTFYDTPVIVSWYGSHGMCNCFDYYSYTYLEAGKGYWMDYIQQEIGGVEGAVVWVKRPGSETYVNLDANLLPGMIYTRNYVYPEPTITYPIHINRAETYDSNLNLRNVFKPEELVRIRAYVLHDEGVEKISKAYIRIYNAYEEFVVEEEMSFVESDGSAVFEYNFTVPSREYVEWKLFGGWRYVIFASDEHGFTTSIEEYFYVYPVCGDYICEGGETQWSCPQDCPGYCGDCYCNPYYENVDNCQFDCTYCGDNYCGACEDVYNCPQDCAGYCGDGYCNPYYEGVENCPEDCPAPVCGNGVCEEAEAGENVYNCPEDCPGYCGDGYCNPYYESVENCPEDCAVPTPVCGNNVCEEAEGENVYNCPQDCPGYCGDSYCAYYEDVYSCSQDCPGVCGDGYCNPYYENTENCIFDCGQCGDNVCGYGENPTNCPQDCRFRYRVPVTIYENLGIDRVNYVFWVNLTIPAGHKVNCSQEIVVTQGYPEESDIITEEVTVPSRVVSEGENYCEIEFIGNVSANKWRIFYVYYGAYNLVEKSYSFDSGQFFVEYGTVSCSHTEGHRGLSKYLNETHIITAGYGCVEVINLVDGSRYTYSVPDAMITGGYYRDDDLYIISFDYRPIYLDGEDYVYIKRDGNFEFYFNPSDYDYGYSYGGITELKCLKKEEYYECYYVRTWNYLVGKFTAPTFSFLGRIDAPFGIHIFDLELFDTNKFWIFGQECYRADGGFWVARYNVDTYDVSRNMYRAYSGECPGGFSDAVCFDFDTCFVTGDYSAYIVTTDAHIDILPEIDLPKSLCWNEGGYINCWTYAPMRIGNRIWFGYHRRYPDYGNTGTKILMYEYKSPGEGRLLQYGYLKSRVDDKPIYLSNHVSNGYDILAPYKAVATGYTVDGTSVSRAGIILVRDQAHSVGQEEYLEEAPVCGNNVCEAGEDIYNCPQDCSGYCGDGYCNPYYESVENCPEDCAVPAPVNEISSCSRIDVPGEYVVVNDLELTEESQYCVGIFANNVVLDCQGHRIELLNPSIYSRAIEVAGDFGNVTIKNCVIKGFTEAGVFMGKNNWNIVVRNVTVNDSRTAVQIGDGHHRNIDIDYINVYNPTFRALNLCGGDTILSNITVSNVYAEGNGSTEIFGIRIECPSNNVTIRDSTFRNFVKAMEVNMNNSLIYNNTIIKDIPLEEWEARIRIVGSENTTIAKNKIYSDGYGLGIWLCCPGNNNVTIEDNEIIDIFHAIGGSSVGVNIRNNYIVAKGTGIMLYRYDVYEVRDIVAEGNTIIHKLGRSGYCMAYSTAENILVRNNTLIEENLYPDGKTILLSAPLRNVTIVDNNITADVLVTLHVMYGYQNVSIENVVACNNDVTFNTSWKIYEPYFIDRGGYLVNVMRIDSSVCEPYLSAVFNYDAIDFGAVQPYNTYDVVKTMQIDSNMINISFSVSGTDLISAEDVIPSTNIQFSPSATLEFPTALIPIESIVKYVFYYLPNEFNNIVENLFRFTVPLVRPGIYTGTITIGVSI